MWRADEAPPANQAWEDEKHNTIARCMAESYIPPDEEEEMMLKLFRTQTPSEKRRWLAWRVGRTDAYAEWYASKPLDPLEIVFSNADREEARKIVDEQANRQEWAAFVGACAAPKDT